MGRNMKGPKYKLLKHRFSFKTTKGASYDYVITKHALMLIVYKCDFTQSWTTNLYHLPTPSPLLAGRCFGRGEQMEHLF